MRALVTRWRKVGAFGRVGPEACEVDTGRADDKVVVRVMQHGGQKMSLLFAGDDAEGFAWDILRQSEELRNRKSGE